MLIANANANADAVAEPYITLSASSPSSADGANISESPNTSPEESFDESTPLHGKLSATHDTRRADYHMKDLEAFAKDLQNAANRAFPSEGLARARYNNVSVLLLRWEDDEMNVEWELDDIEKIFRDYGFETDRWLIPTKNSHLKLMSKVVDIVEENDASGNLVIVYYVGHAGINSSRGATWTCKQDPQYASLEWSAIQTLFEKADFDVLLLLDCCAAASAAPAVGSAVTETIAACGFESIAPQPGQYSFTNSLIEVLEGWIDSPPFSAAMLHNQVLSILKHERPERMQNRKRRGLEFRRTPIHMVATADLTLPSIELGRRMPKRGGISSPTAASGSKSTAMGVESASAPGSSNSNAKGYQKDSMNLIQGKEYEIPRVIISLTFEKHQKLGSESCQKWLASCPTLIKYAKVEAVYDSFSALILLSLPVFIWNLLPENAACSFVGYVTSPNLMGLDLGSKLPTAKEDNTQKKKTYTQIDPVKKPVQVCDNCSIERNHCDGAAQLGGCGACRVAGSFCVFTPNRRWDGPSKVYMDAIRKRFEEQAIALEEEQAKNAKLSAHSLPSISQELRSTTMYQSLGPPQDATGGYDKHLLHKFDNSRGRMSTPCSEQEADLRETRVQLPSCPELALRTTLSPVSRDHGTPPLVTHSKVPASQYQYDDIQRQQITKRDAISKDNIMGNVPLPFPPPRHLFRDDEASRNDMKLGWIAPKSEHSDISRSSSLPDRKIMVKTEPTSYESKGCNYPPEKKMKISSVTESRYMGPERSVIDTTLSEKKEPSKSERPLPGTRFLNRDRHSYETGSRPRNSDQVSLIFMGQSNHGRDTTMAYSHPPSQIPPSFEHSITPPHSSSTTTHTPPTHVISTHNFHRTPERQLRESTPSAKQAPQNPVHSPIASRSAPADQDWTYITDIAERRRIQNRIAQRNYRKRMKRRLEDLEDRAGALSSQSSSSAPPPLPAASAPEHSYAQYREPLDDVRDPAKLGGIVRDLQPFRRGQGIGDTLGRYMPEGGPAEGGPAEDMTA